MKLVQIDVFVGAVCLRDASGAKDGARNPDLRIPGQLRSRGERLGARLEGPCILEEPGSTTLVEPGMTVEVLPDGQLLIETGAS